MGGKRTLGDASYKRSLDEEASMELGDTVVDRSGLKGRVVANIDRDEFSRECPKSEWAYLAQGIMVLTDEAGLVHYQSAEELTRFS
jgi:hypothetical protein